MKNPFKHIKPVGDYLLLSIDETVGKKQGSIYIPEAHREISHEAIVMAVGSGKNIPIELKIGSRVIVQRYTGTDIVMDEQHVRLFPVDKILAIIETK